MRVKPIAFVAAAGLSLLVATLLGWMAYGTLADSRHMSELCGTSMTNSGLWMVSVAFVVAGVFAVIGVAMFVAARAARVPRQKPPARTKSSDRTV